MSRDTVTRMDPETVTYEQAPSLFEVAQRWQDIANDATRSAEEAAVSASVLASVTREMFGRLASEANARALIAAAQGIAAIAQPPSRSMEGDRILIDGAPFVVTRVTPGSLAVEEDSVQARERVNRRRWRARILARLDNPTEDDRAEAAEVAAWVRTGDPLPLR